MKERPILFNGPMVRAILNGRKTQTRRVVKGPFHKDNFVRMSDDLGYPASLGHLWAGFRWPEDPIYTKSPYGQPGDRLWVRETWAPGPSADEDGMPLFVYRADGEPPEHVKGWKWRPSIHMPRWASRLTLEITAVRVERLQDISWMDVDAEGIGDMLEDPCSIAGEAFGYAEHISIAGGSVGMAAEMYGVASYWDSIAKPGERWADNPWVWVYKFSLTKSKEATDGDE